MRNRELERRLTEALSHTAPDDLGGVLSRCETRKGAEIPMKKRRTALAAACLALALVCGGGLFTWRQANAVASVISLDVNPSIELTVNRQERVLTCAALNEDAAKVLADMDGGADLKGAKLDVAVNAVVGALVRSGYLDSISSAILISVEDKDESRAQRLQQELVASVDQVLTGSNTEILSQVLTYEPAMEQAGQQKVSSGKSALVLKVMQMNGTINLNSTTAFDQLYALSVEELNALLENEIMKIPVGKEKARYAVEEYAGTLGIDSTSSDVASKFGDSRPRYEVTLWPYYESDAYLYLVDAFTGEVYSGEADVLGSLAAGYTPVAPGPQAVDEVQTAAFNAAAEYHAKRYPELGGYNFFDIKCEPDVNRYEIEFVCAGYKFEYEVDIKTGAILKEDTDYPGPATSSKAPTQSEAPAQSEPPASSAAVEYIGKDAAIQAAMKHAGVTYRDDMPLTFNYDWSGKTLHYDIEFWDGGYDYEYEIDAVTGAVLDAEKEVDDLGVIGAADGPTAIYTTGYTAEDAKAAAFRHAGCAEADTAYCNAYLDYDDGVPECYKVEFCWGGSVYEYEISCHDCSILDWGCGTCGNHQAHSGGHHGGYHHGYHHG